MKTEIKNLQLKTLQESSGNPQKMDDKTFTGLIDSIKRKGWYFAMPDVWEFKPGKYRIISGHHRIRAGMKAGLIEQNCNVIIDPAYSEEQARKDLLESNERHGSPEIDLLKDFVNDIVDDFDIDLDILVDEIGLSEEHYDLINFTPEFLPGDIEDQPRLDQKTPIVCPHCGESFEK